MAEHTPTPWAPSGKFNNHENGVFIYGGKSALPVATAKYLGGTNQAWANARHVVACVNAFHDPNRSIATEHISEGLVWRMYGMLEDFMYAAGSTERARAFAAAQEFIASLKVQSDG